MKRTAYAAALLAVVLVAPTTLAQEAVAPASSQKTLAATMNVYVFPTAGQPTEQQSTDEAACYGWAVQNTGSDPFQLEKQAEAQQQQAEQQGRIPGRGQQPEQQQFLKFSLSIPILDWGRSASQVKLAESQRDLVIFDVEKDIQDFERSIVVQVEKFNLLKDQLETAKEADKVAENGYEIALKKFQNGEISITELKISLSERESAKRDYIRSIEDYWESYYYIRILTLYDFEYERKIFYDNPMLAGEDPLR